MCFMRGPLGGIHPRLATVRTSSGHPLSCDCKRNIVSRQDEDNPSSDLCIFTESMASLHVNSKQKRERESEKLNKCR